MNMLSIAAHFGEKLLRNLKFSLVGGVLVVLLLIIWDLLWLHPLVINRLFDAGNSQF